MLVNILVIYFQFLAITNKAVLNICVQVSIQVFLLIIYLEEEWLEWKENPIVNVWHFKKLLNLFLKRWSYSPGLPWWLSGKESDCQCRRHELDPWLRKIPKRRKWQPIPEFLPRKPHGQRSLVGYSPWGCKRVGHNLATKQ